MKVQLANVRIAFAHLFVPQDPPKGQQGGDAKYGTQVIIDPATSNAKALTEAVTAVANEKWGAKAKVILAELKKKGLVCYHEEPKTNTSGEVYEGFEDMHYVSCSNKARPLVIDRNKQSLTQADGRPYSGSFNNVLVELWAQDNQYGKRINATLKGVQFVRDGDAFSGGTPASPEEFDDLGADTEAADLPV